MQERAAAIVRIVGAVHPEWIRDFGESYVFDEVQAVLGGTANGPPRGEGAEETDVGMIAAALVQLTQFILNVLLIAEKIKEPKKRVAAIRAEVSHWPTKDKEALIEALLDEID